MERPLWVKVWKFLIKPNVNLAYNKTTSLFGTYPKEMKINVHKKDLYKDDRNSSIHNIQKLETVHLSINRKIDKLQYIHTMEYYPMTKKENKLLMHATTWMNFKTIMLSERASHTRMHIAWLMCNSRPGKFNLCFFRNNNNSNNNSIIIASGRMGAGIDGKGECRTFWGAGNVLYLEMGMGYIYTFVKTQPVFT